MTSSGTVFRIHDISVWIRIRIRRSMPLSLMDPGSGCGSGSYYSRHWPNYFPKVFLLITFWRYIMIIFQRWKVQEKSQNSKNQGFSYYFCLMIEGSGSGSTPLTNGSGSGRPKNMWIRNTVECRGRYLLLESTAAGSRMMTQRCLAGSCLSTSLLSRRTIHSSNSSNDSSWHRAYSTGKWRRQYVTYLIYDQSSNS